MGKLAEGGTCGSGDHLLVHLRGDHRGVGQHLRPTHAHIQLASFQEEHRDRVPRLVQHALARLRELFLRALNAEVDVNPLCRTPAIGHAPARGVGGVKVVSGHGPLGLQGQHLGTQEAIRMVHAPMRHVHLVVPLSLATLPILPALLLAHCEEGRHPASARHDDRHPHVKGQRELQGRRACTHSIPELVPVAYVDEARSNEALFVAELGPGVAWQHGLAIPSDVDACLVADPEHVALQEGTSYCHLTDTP
mmetsp:Transcript_100549/g.252078  ORF Transcript_100549/g.252078 Transcript_100549/m.252078 type:complete len:250 (-) Transcript_100549:300-1049(-)